MAAKRNYFAFGKSRHVKSIIWRLVACGHFAGARSAERADCINKVTTNIHSDEPQPSLKKQTTCFPKKCCFYNLFAFLYCFLIWIPAGEVNMVYWLLLTFISSHWLSGGLWLKQHHSFIILLVFRLKLLQL